MHGLNVGKGKTGKQAKTASDQHANIKVYIMNLPQVLRLGEYVQIKNTKKILYFCVKFMRITVTRQ